MLSEKERIEPNDDQIPTAPKVQAFCSIEFKDR